MTQSPSTLNPRVHPQERTQHSTLLIRADATRQMGNGHVMRCLALAAEWQARGGRVVFLTHADNPAIAARIDNSGAERIVACGVHPHPADLPDMLSLAYERQPAWTILDGYHFMPCYQQAVQEAMRLHGGKTLIMDDMAHQPDYHADILVNQNVYADTLTYSCTSDTLLLPGAQYALLRPEFAGWQARRRSHPITARNVLVTLGGTDPDNVTLKVIQAMASWRCRNFNVKIIVGPGNPHQPVLQQAVETSSCDIDLLFAPGNMAELMAYADLAVAAAGTTTLELAYMQVPTLSLVLADNQQRVATELAAAGTLHNLGRHENVSAQSLACAISSLAHNLNARRSMAQAGKQLVDGNGSRRVVDAMRDTIDIFHKSTL